MIIRPKEDVIELGYETDNNAVEVQFPVGRIVNEHGEGTWSVFMVRPSERIPYRIPSAQLRVDGGNLFWRVTANETAFSGHGAVQIKYVSGNVVCHSHVYNVVIGKAMNAISNVPSSIQSWIDIFEEFERKLDAINITATASVSNTTGTPAVNVTKSGEDYAPNFAFAFSGLKGEKGARGAAGPAGPAGPQGEKGDKGDSTVYTARKPIVITDGEIGITGGSRSGYQIGNNATVEGSNCVGSGSNAHAEGSSCEATSSNTHAEGYNTRAVGYNAHSEGMGTSASGNCSHAEGVGTIASGYAQHASGRYNTEDDTYLEMVGNGTDENARSNARTLDSRGNEVLAGKLTLGAGPTIPMDAATKQYVDEKVVSSGYTGRSPVKVHNRDISLTGGAKEGSTVGANAVIEGYECVGSGTNSHAEGAGCEATDSDAHAEGLESKATSPCAHAEGIHALASGVASHAEGVETTASQQGAHAEGTGTIASQDSQHAGGKYNIEDTSGTYAEIIGNGTSEDARSNARTLDWNGNEVLAGKLTVGAGPSNPMDVPTKQYVDDKQTAYENVYRQTSYHLTSDLGITDYEDPDDITSDSVERAYKAGYKSIKICVRFSSDTKPVCSEEPRVLINGTRYTIADTAWSTLSAALVSAEDVILAAKRLGMEVCIDLMTNTFTQTQLDALYAVVAKHGMAKDVWWQGWTASNLLYIQSIQRDAKLAPTNYLTTSAIDTAASYKTPYNEVMLCVPYNEPESDFSDATLIYAAKAGVPIKVYPCNGLWNTCQYLDKVRYLEVRNVKNPDEKIKNTYLT